MKQRTKTAFSGALLLTAGIVGITYFAQTTNTDYDVSTNSALPVKALATKSLDTNPYMATSDVNIFITIATIRIAPIPSCL